MTSGARDTPDSPTVCGGAVGPTNVDAKEGAVTDDHSIDLRASLYLSSQGRPQIGAVIALSTCHAPIGLPT